MCLKNISDYDGKVNHSFRDYKTDDRKSLPRIARRRLQVFYIVVAGINPAVVEFKP